MNVSSRLGNLPFANSGRGPQRGLSHLRLRPRLRQLTAAVALLEMSCTWTRFDDILKNSPVQIVTTPSDTNALGLSVAAMRGKSSTLAFSSAIGGYAIYEFTETDLASNDALAQGLCVTSDDCWSSTTVAALGQSVEGVANACFAFGVEHKATEDPRVLLACENNLVRGLALPNPAPADLLALQPSSKAPRVQFASGPRLAPDLLLAATSTSGAMWFYPPGTSTPIAIPTPLGAGKSFGEAVAVAGTATWRFFAVGEPASARLYVMRTDGTTLPNASLCITSTSTNFAVAIAAGHFTAADSEDIAVASDREVVVLPAIDSLPFSADPAAPCIEISTLTARTLSCETLYAANPCGGRLASVALAASDLNRDGRDELLLGTPSAATRGNDATGQVLVTSFGKEKPVLVQELSLSSAESGDRLGTSITGVPLSRPEVVLAGAPGGNKLAAFFCTSLLPPNQGGARCD